MNHHNIMRLALVLALALSSLPGGHAAAYTITVDTTSAALDAAGGVCSSITYASLPGGDTVTSLPEAICAANNESGADTIEFDIPNSLCDKTTHVCNIQPTSCLPALTDDYTTIDGYSQPPDAAPATRDDPAVILIELDGTNAGSCDGLTINSADNLVMGLAINRFTGSGIYISGSGASGNVIQGNYIGTDPSGEIDLGNTLYGVRIQNGASNNLIGGSTFAHLNLISGNESSGVYIYGSGTDGNVVSRNYIGVDIDGDTGMGNGTYGVSLSNGSQWNIIGGDTVHERNVISANDSYGVRIYGTDTISNTVSGNFIGVDASGGVALGNDGYGVYLANNAHSNTIGGDTAGERNVISGNLDEGIYIQTDHNIVSGNYIGIDASGDVVLANSGVGVQIDGDYNTVGGATPGERNVISGNTSSGICINGGIGNTISGNYIGTDKDGDTDLGNDWNGVYLTGGSQENTIGGDSAGERNVISGNQKNGVHIYASDTLSNTVSGNYIGLDASGGIALGNSERGVYISNYAHSNTIGGDTAGERNVISGNGMSGIHIHYTNNNTISGNYIGTDAGGSLDLGNVEYGIYVLYGDNNGIGGSVQGERNLISGNTYSGVYISNSDGNSVSGNFIGVDASGAIALGNDLYGVRISEGSINNTIGPNNLIANNFGDGVWVNSASDFGNIITQNAIYSNASGIGLGYNANGGIQPPVIVTATFGSVNITGTACAGCTVEVFQNSDNDGEGESYIGDTLADTNGDFTLTVPFLTQPYLTATATDATDGTSEFSAVYDASGLVSEVVFLPLVVR
jgi:hypothetical protein